jgi:hypothetical protein
MSHERIARHDLPIACTPLDQARSLGERVAALLSQPGEVPDAAVLASLARDLPLALSSAFDDGSAAARFDVHQALFVIYEAAFANPLAPAAAHERAPWLLELRHAIEQAWMTFELRAIAPEIPDDDTLSSVVRLCTWFVAHARRETALDRRVVRFLAEEATAAQLRLFVVADAHLNYRFYDALALVQQHYCESVKAELSRHMWDECGGGDAAAAHTRQFSRALDALGLPLPHVPVWNDWRPYAGYNLYLCLGTRRAHYFKALGSLAMPELFDPGRDRAVVAGMARLGLPRSEYYHSHIDGDEAHGESWLENVITPIVSAQPEAARELAIGGALRMQAMRRYNEYLALTFGVAA